MNFITRSQTLVGQHAFLSASQYSWLNYDEDKLARVFHAAQASKRGTELHTFAHEAIRLGIKLPEAVKTLNLYINDAIGFRMTPEQLLYFSDNCYGTADCISFRKNMLRIHDLKTGVTPASPSQLKIYIALFCLEYKFRPFDIEMELRIYQNDGVQAEIPDPDEIFHIMEKVKYFDKYLNDLKMEVES